jgi:hypothetical protein
MVQLLNFAASWPWHHQSKAVLAFERCEKDDLAGAGFRLKKDLGARIMQSQRPGAFDSNEISGS